MSPHAQVQDFSALGHLVALGPQQGYRSKRGSKVRAPGKTNMTMPVAAFDHDDNVWRVRLSRVVRDGQGSYMGKPLRHLEEFYLDGIHVVRTYGNDQITRDERTQETSMAVIAGAQTKDIIDLGRVEQACIALVQAIDKAGADPSDEQAESFLRSYQSIIAWREQVATRLVAIDGAIDVASAKVRRAMA